MSRQPPGPVTANDSTDDVMALIGVLHESGQRLEELTAGEVDTVADRNGRTFLLRRAQDHLRQHEAARQRAILDALPMHIALLDAQGVIVSVNEAWRQYSGANALHRPDFGVGLNYLEACDSIAGAGAPQARQVAAGVRAVLAGSRRHFSLDCCCQAPSEACWFQLTVSPLAGEPPDGAVVMLLDISGQKRAVQEQRELQQLLDNIIDHIPTAVQLRSVHDGFRIKRWNKAAEAMFGLPRAAAIGRTVHELWPADAADWMHASDLDLVAQGRLQDFPDRLLPTVNGTVHAHVRQVALFDDRGQASHLLVIADDISERRSAEQEFRDLLEFAPDAMVIVNQNAEIVRVNSQTVNLFGWSRDELLGQKIEMLVPESRRGAHPPCRDGFLESPKIRTMGAGKQLLARRRDGSEFPVEISLSPLLTEGGSLVMGAIRDISERELAERETRLLAARLSNTLESITDAFFTVDRDWRINYVNVEAERMFELQRDNLIGKVLWDVFPHLSASEFGEGYRRAMDENRAAIFEAFFSPWATWYRANAYPSDDGLTVYLRDVTAERAARQQLELLEASVARLNDMVVITEALPQGEDGRRIVFVNDAFVRFTGYSRADVLGKSPRLLRGPLTDPTVVESIYAGLATYQPVHAELINYRKNGEAYWGEIDIVPIGMAGAEYSHFVAIERDISERKRAEDELRALNADLESRVRARTAELNLAREEAEQANRAKSDFLAVMSHEIRTPMNGVVGMIDVLEQSNLDGEQMAILKIAHQSAYSLLAIVNDVLDFSKIEAGKFVVEREPMDVAAVLEGVCDTLDPLACVQGVELLLFTDPAIPPRVFGDAARLRQVLLNLVGNAIKFSRVEGRAGQISVRVGRRDAYGHGELEFRIIDNGIGMDPETVSRLFAPFNQADASTTRRFGGTGLGLSISRGLIELMDGTIGVRSESGRGSTFSVRLPLRPAPTLLPADSGAVDLGGLCCLLLGSEDRSVDDLSIYLDHSGARVHRVPDRHAARRWLADCPVNLCVVVVADGVNAGDEMFADLRADGRGRADLELHFVVIERGQRRGLRVKAPDLYSLDRNILRRSVFLGAVAVAAGRVAAPTASASPFVAGRTPVPLAAGAVSARRRLILIAEDNEINQQVLVQQLTLLGFEADVVSTGLAALECWRQGNYALLLTDLRMPQMDGYRLVQAIRRAEAGARRLPIVALTANALKSEAARCLEVGMDDFMTKPFRLVDLKAILDKWLPQPGGSAPLRVTGLLADAVDTVCQPAWPAPSGYSATAGDLPVDLTVLAALVGDDPQVIGEMLQAFRRSALRSSAAIRQGADAGDPRAIADAAHTLKSGARSIGAQRLGELCVDIEHHAATADAPELEALLRRFASELATVCRFLDSR